MGADAIWISFPVGSLTTLVLAAGYYRWGGWRKSRMLPAGAPASDAPDTGFGQPMVEEAEAVVEADDLRRSAPSAPDRPASEAPAE
jgi:hypothetical protein